ncbi:unnamed protein product [Symbiodinium sp. CCMP2592]|nr:unnamed protein product [Symbiodinium sp. CCMP2592]
MASAGSDMQFHMVQVRNTFLEVQTSEDLRAQDVGPKSLRPRRSKSWSGSSSSNSCHENSSGDAEKEQWFSVTVSGQDCGRRVQATAHHSVFDETSPQKVSRLGLPQAVFLETWLITKLETCATASTSTQGWCTAGLGQVTKGLPERASGNGPNVALALAHIAHQKVYEEYKDNPEKKKKALEKIAGASPYMRSLLKSLGEKDEEEVLAHLAKADEALPAPKVPGLQPADDVKPSSASSEDPALKKSKGKILISL